MNSPSTIYFKPDKFRIYLEVFFAILSLLAFLILAICFPIFVGISNHPIKITGYFSLMVLVGPGAFFAIMYYLRNAQSVVGVTNEGISWVKSGKSKVHIRWVDVSQIKRTRRLHNLLTIYGRKKSDRIKIDCDFFDSKQIVDFVQGRTSIKPCHRSTSS